MKMSIKSALRPPIFQMETMTGSPESLMAKLTIRVRIAVLRNYAIPSFFATLTSYDVRVECLSD